MEKLKLFVQGEGVREIKLVELPTSATVRDLVAAAAALGFPAALDGTSAHLFLEDADDAVDLKATLRAAGIANHGSVHIHRCKKIAVTVHFNGSKAYTFSPGATIGHVKKWATSKKGFGLTDVDAAEHVLQVAGTQDRPDEDVHIGVLVPGGQCEIAFDLVAKIRVEG